MLALSPTPGRLRRADNLVPTATGGLRSRPSAIQVVDGRITGACAWGPWLLLERAGRIGVWDGASVQDIAQAGLWLRGAPFAALTDLGEREARIYIADGARPLWYIAHRAGAFVAEPILNTLTDDGGVGYPVAVAVDVAIWRNRLWAVDATLPQRVTHSENDDPAKWDPLWAIEIQSGQRDRIQTLAPAGERLIVGFARSLWAVTGDTPYNWARSELYTRGTGGPGTLLADGESLAWISQDGIYLDGRQTSSDLAYLFGRPMTGAQVAFDPSRGWLLAAIDGRLFVTHLAQAGLWGEIVGSGPVLGALRWDGKLGWWGLDGLWVLGQDDISDVYLDGSSAAFESRYDTWEETPSLEGSGRILLERDVFRLAGSARGSATYTVTADGALSFTQDVSLTDETPTTFSEIQHLEQGPELVPKGTFEDHSTGTWMQNQPDNPPLGIGAPVVIPPAPPSLRVGGRDCWDNEAWFAVAPGERYFITARCNTVECAANAGLGLYFMRPDPRLDNWIYADTKLAGEDWETLSGYVEVPAGYDSSILATVWLQIHESFDPPGLGYVFWHAISCRLEYAVGEPMNSWPLRPVRREFVPRLPGSSFRRQLRSNGHLEILDNTPAYRRGGGAS